MKALILTIACLLSAKAMAFGTIELEAKPITVEGPAAVQPIEGVAPVGNPALGIANPLTTQEPAKKTAEEAAACKGDLAEQMSQGLNGVNVDEVREALRFLNANKS